MQGGHRFSAIIEAAKGGGAYVTVPFDVEAAFGKKRVPVVARIDGVTYRGSLVRMGGPSHVLGILKDIQREIGKGVGDEIEVVLDEDTAPRTVEVPGDLKSALSAAPGAASGFAALSFSRRRELVRWIEAAKREETRKGRVAAAVEECLGGTRPR